jgi:hypothetical protein
VAFEIRPRGLATDAHPFASAGPVFERVAERRHTATMHQNHGLGKRENAAAKQRRKPVMKDNVLALYQSETSEC